MKVHWRVAGVDAATSQSSDDVMPTSGSTLLQNGVSVGQITLSVLADELPELDEHFIVTLVAVDGGADIDTAGQTSSFTIRYVHCSQSGVDNISIILISVQLHDVSKEGYVATK